MPKLPLSNNENEPPSWSSFNIVPSVPPILEETKLINVKNESIPEPTINEINWFELKEDANIPIDRVAALYNNNPI